MNWSPGLYVWLSLAGSLAMAAVAVYAWRRGNRAAVLFAVVAAAAGVWALGNALEIAAAGLPAKVWWAKVQYVGIVTLPVAWVGFAMQFTSRAKWLTRRWLVLSMVVPAATLLLVFSNEAHHLMWTALALDTAGAHPTLLVAHGPWFWVHTAYSTTCNLLGAFLLLLTMVRAPDLYRQQSAVLLCAFALPWIGNLIYISGVSTAPNWDPTPAAFLLSGLVIAWGARRLHLLDLLPVARETLVDASGDGLIVLDPRNRVVDLNTAAQYALGRSARSAIGQPATQLLAFRPDLLGPASMQEPARTEIALAPAGENGTEARAYDLTVTPLTDERGRFAGRLIALRDITERKRTEAELRAQKQLFEDLVAVARATAEGPTLEVTLQNALNVAARLTGAERGSLFLLSASGTVTHSLLTYGGITPRQRQHIVRRVMDRGLSGWVVRHRQPALISDTSRDERWLATQGEGFPVASALGVPITSGNVLVGVMTLSHSRPNCFTPDQLRLMQAAADQMALALRNAQIFEAQRVMAQRQAALYGLLRAVGEQHTPEAVARAAADAIVQLVGSQASWPGVGIALPDRERRHWTYYPGESQLAPLTGRVFPFERGVIGRAFRTGQPQHVSDVQADPDYVTGHPDSRSELAMPIRRGERVLGVLNLESDQEEAFTAEDVQLAESLADAVALALDNAYLYQAVADESSRLQALIKSSRDGILMVSVDQRFLVMNAPVLMLLRLPGQPEDWLGRPTTDLLRALRRVAPQAARVMLAELRRLRRGDEAPAEGETQVPPRAVHWLSLPVLAGETPLGRLLVLRDVTEERLVQKMRDDLTDTMVHDLRNPLTNIRMSLELLGQLSQWTPGTQPHDVLQIARGSTERMLMLVNAILDVSRLESGQMPLMREALHLPSLVDEVISLQSPLAHEKRLTLENGVPDSVPQPSADAGLVQRVLQNLLGNAIKFTPDGGCVRVDAHQPNPDEVQLSVRDSGPGLAPEIRDRLFQKFVTGRVSERGSGLGLAFCKLAIEAHGGRIWVESEPGQGSVFHFTLPLASDEALDNDTGEDFDDEEAGAFADRLA